MKTIFISDTHGQHNFISVPDGDMIIHAGDVSSSGKPHEVKSFLDWFTALPHKYKIFIAGNHDFYFDSFWKPRTEFGGMRHRGKTLFTEEDINEMIPDNLIYLNDSSVEVEGIKIWGSPITPWFHDWAFNRNRGKEIKSSWDLIPGDTDILITHGPPKGMLDRIEPRFVRPGEDPNVGCEDLMARVMEVKPKIHVFGHIHETYGTGGIGEIKFINASVLNSRYENVNDPIVVEI